jgi:uncharacterized membrane protein
MEKEYIKVLIILLILDIPMITIVNKKMYFSMFDKINNNQNMIINNNKIISGIIAYLLLAYGLYYFIIKKNLTKNDAFILGIIIYGVYNTTNYFTLNNYSGKVAIIDTFWGGILFYLIIWIYSKNFF